MHSAAAFLESIHVNVAEFISIYKAKTKFVEKIKLMVFQQQQRIELAELKHRHNLELLREKEKGNAVDAQQGEGGGYVFNTDDIVKSLAKSDAFRSAEFTMPRDEDGLTDEDEDDDTDEDQEDEDGHPVKRKRK